MGIIAWIVLGLGAGLLANLLIPGRRSQGLVITCVIGIAGALLGGWLATKLFHVVTLHGFFNLSHLAYRHRGRGDPAAGLPPGHQPQRRPQPQPRPVTPVGAPVNTRAPHRLPPTAPRRA